MRRWQPLSLACVTQSQSRDRSEKLRVQSRLATMQHFRAWLTLGRSRRRRRRGEPATLAGASRSACGLRASENGVMTYNDYDAMAES
jgi:hypothetical protein